MALHILQVNLCILFCPSFSYFLNGFLPLGNVKCAPGRSLLREESKKSRRTMRNDTININTTAFVNVIIVIISVKNGEYNN